MVLKFNLFLHLLTFLFFQLYFTLINSAVTPSVTGDVTETPASTVSITSSTAKINYLQIDWPDKSCLSGKQQSPINIQSDISKLNKTKVIQIEKHSYQILNRVAVQTYQNKKFMVNGTSLGSLWIIRDGVRYQYDALDIHFHFPSEHTIDNEFGDLEIHIFHVKNQDFLKKQNMTYDPDKRNTHLTLVTIYSAQSVTDDPTLKQFKIERKGPVAKLDLSSFIPIYKPFYYYEGSRSSPNCDENVNYIINQEIKKMSKKQMIAFVEWITELYSFKGNHRMVQNLNNRTLYYISYPSPASYGFLLKPQNILLIICLILIVEIFLF